MADVMDLFIERIDGDTYEFEGEWRPLELIEEEISVKRRAEPERLVVRETHHGPIVNEALRADDAEPLALRFAALDFPGITPASLGMLDFASGAELVERAGPARPPRVEPRLGRPPRLDRIQDGRPPSDPPGRLPGPAEAGLDGRVRVGRLGPVRGAARADATRRGFRGHGQQPDRPRGLPHHITSDYLDGYRARRIEQLIEASTEHDLESFEAMQTDMLSLPGLETARRLARLRPVTSGSWWRSSDCAPGTAG